MDYSALSTKELSESLRALSAASGASELAEQLQETVQELHAHRIELEMQNRALRESQSELELALRRYTDLYDHLPIGFVTLTRKGRIVHANLTAAEWLRRDRDRLVGSYLTWFLDAFDAGRFAAHLNGCVANASDCLLEVTLRVEGGLLLTVQFSSRLVPAQRPGEEDLVHMAITNISKLKHTQQVLEDINREHEAINDSLSREMRTPLVTISHHARNLLERHADSLTAEVKSGIERMECAAFRLESTLQHLLEFSSLGFEDVALDPVNVDEVVQNVLVEHRALIQQRQAEIELERPLPCVRGSRLILAHVLANLLLLTLRSSTAETRAHVRLSAESRGEKVVLKFSDRGRELEPEECENIFRAFERPLGAPLPKTSIELCLIRRAVERMNGHASFESEPGRGSCFSIELPRV